MTLPTRVLLALSLGVLCGRSVADETTGKSDFNWGWLTLDSTTVKQCESYGIYLMSPPQDRTPDYGTPPYYMFEYKANGVPIVSNIGNDRNNLTWTVKQAGGSSLFLTITDSKGKQGGVAQKIYNVNGGKSGCAPKPPSTEITLYANVSTSDPLQTCEPIGLRVNGGRSPYTISLVAIDSTVVRNVTLGPSDDILTWPSLAVPNKSLIASVSDSSGTWGKSTDIFKTAGCAVTNQTKCSITMSSGNLTTVDQHPKEKWSPENEKCSA